MTEHKPWLSLPDEEPPERGLADLLAAARMKADQMAEQHQATPPWWKRLLAALRRPPVLALATVVVLIGGVIIVGGHHDQAASPAPSLDVPPGQLDTRARGTVPEAPPPPPPEEQAPRGEVRQQTAQPPVEGKHDVQSLDAIELGGEKQIETPIAPNQETEAVDDRAALGKKAVDTKKAGLSKPADPLARCRAAAARRDCATAKACVKDMGAVDVGNDAALKSCL